MTDLEKQQRHLSDKLLKQIDKKFRPIEITEKNKGLSIGLNSSLNKEDTITTENNDNKNNIDRDSFVGLDLIKGSNKVFTSLSFSKNNLFFKSKPKEIAFDTVTIKNIGTTCIYFKWQKNGNQNKIPEKKGDGIDKFFCHYSDSKLSPNESKEFYFSFFAERNGNFYEDWTLITSPQVKNINLNLHLNGLCIQIVDNYTDSVNNFNTQMQKSSVKTFIKELVLELISNIKHNEPALPDMSNVEDFKYYFIKLNKAYNVEYSKYAMDLFNTFSSNVINYLKQENSDESHWEGGIDQLKSFIKKIKDTDTKNMLNFQLECIIHLSRERQTEDSPLYNSLKSLIEDLSLEIGDQINLIREELIFHPLIFDFLTRKSLENKELDKFNQEQKKKIDEFYKKNKKKQYKNNVEEETDLKIMKDKLFEKVENILHHKITQIYKEEQRQKLNNLVVNNNIFTDAYVNNFLAKVDTLKLFKNIENQIVVLRIDINDSDVIYEEDNQEYNDNYEKEYIITKIKGSDKIFKSLETLINLRAKIVIVLIDFGPKNGVFNHKYTTRLIKDYIVKENIYDQTSIEFEPSYEGLLYLNERLNEESPDINLYPNLKENSVLILENINFNPEECGFELFELSKQQIENNASQFQESQIIQESQKSMSKSDKDKDKSKLYDADMSKNSNNIISNNSQSNINVNANMFSQKMKLNYFSKVQFLKKICSNFPFYINDSINSFYHKYPTIIDVQNSKRILGTRLEDQFSKITSFFTINTKNFLLIVGSDLDNSLSADCFNTLLTVNTIMNRFKSIMLLGKFGILFSLLIQSEYHFGKEYTLPREFIDLMKYIIIKAKLNGIEIILPEDLRIFPTKEYNRFFGYDEMFYSTIYQSLLQNESGEVPYGPNDINIKNYVIKEKLNINDLIANGLNSLKDNNEPLISENKENPSNDSNIKSTDKDFTTESQLNSYFKDGIDYISFYIDYIRILEKREKKAKQIEEAATGDDELEENEDYKYYKLNISEIERLGLLEKESLKYDFKNKIDDFFKLQDVKLPKKMLKNEKEELEFLSKLYFNTTIMPDNSHLPTDVSMDEKTKEKINDKLLVVDNKNKNRQNKLKSSSTQINIVPSSQAIETESKPVINLPTRKNLIPEGYSLIDYGNSTYKKLESKINEANCVFWLGEITPTKVVNLFNNFESLIQTLTNRKAACKKETDEIFTDDGKKIDSQKAKRFLLNILIKSNKTYETLKNTKKKLLFSNEQEEGEEEQVDDDALLFEMISLIDYFLDDKLSVIDKLLQGEHIPGLYGLTISNSAQLEEEELDLKFLDEI